MITTIKEEKKEILALKEEIEEAFTKHAKYFREAKPASYSYWYESGVMNSLTYVIEKLEELLK